jgi:hypothetical protein
MGVSLRRGPLQAQCEAISVCLHLATVAVKMVQRSVDDLVREGVAAGPEWLPHGMQAGWRQPLP